MLLRRRLFDFFLPHPCLGCRSPVRLETIPEEDSRLGLCGVCMEHLEAPREHTCRGCGRWLGAPGAAKDGAESRGEHLCGECRRRPPAYDEIHAGWAYRAPLDKVVLGLKHGRLDYLGTALGERLAARFAHQLQGLDVVVPVPTIWWRRLGRGYNHAERIARPVARSLDLPCRGLLRRSAKGGRQKGRGRQARLDNLNGALRSRPVGSAKGILLVDDVITTGATLDAAARALKAAGAERVVALAAARRDRDF